MSEVRFVLLLVVVLFLGACGGGGAPSTSTTSSTPAQSPTATPSPLSDLESKLQYVRNGQFTYMWVFSRKDGKPFDPGDSTFLRTNAPQVVDWVKTDDGLKVVAGTNFNLEEGNLEMLKKRYIAEDYSGR